LFIRWFQFGAFCPVFRAHGHSWREHLPWSHGPEAEAICRRYIELRYRLLPYTYTLAWRAHRGGIPLMRPMVLADEADPAYWQLGSQYFWGDDLLVAPVTRPGATQWPVLIPAGTWHDYWTGETYRGPCAVSVPAPLERLPLFVRAGAIIPLGPVKQFVDEVPDTEITLQIFAGADGAAELYEDDGTTNGYREGHFAVTGFRMTQAAQGLALDIGSTGDTGLLPPGRSYTLRVHALGPARSVTVDGDAHAAWQRGADGVLVVELPPGARHVEAAM
jgi:alpha-glucosidase (family GH31 glycosyl hydrolase)